MTDKKECWNSDGKLPSINKTLECLRPDKHEADKIKLFINGKQLISISGEITEHVKRRGEK